MSFSSLEGMPSSFTLPSPKYCAQYDINENDDGCILGQGGFGIVTREKCKFEKIKCKGEYVAKKILTNYNPLVVDLIKQEKLIYDKLSKNPSEYVLSMYGTIIDEKNTKVTQYFEYIGGKEFFNYQDTRFIRDIVIGLIKGLKHIHDQDVIHCDIKPENIIIDTSKEPYCPVYIDFGGSVLASKKDDEGVITSMGSGCIPITTPFFREAIAQYEGPIVTARTDVYALLITFMDVPVIYDTNAVDDNETAFIKELRNLNIFHGFTRFWNDGEIIYELIWKSWNFITNKVENISSPSRVPVNNTNHNDPPSFYTMSPMERDRNPLRNIKPKISKQLKKIKGLLTPRTRKREKTPKYAYAEEILPQGRREKLDKNEIIQEIHNIEMRKKQDMEASQQRMMENKLAAARVLEQALTPLEEEEAVEDMKRTVAFNKRINATARPKRTSKRNSNTSRISTTQQDKDENMAEAFVRDVAKRAAAARAAAAKRTSKRNSKTSKISTTQQDMNGYIGGVSKKKFRRSSKKIGKIRNRRRSTKKRR